MFYKKSFTIYSLVILVAHTFLISFHPVYSQVTVSKYFSLNDFSINNYAAKDGNLYSKIEIEQRIDEKLYIIEELGKPCLPVKRISLIVPSDQDVDELEIISLKEQKITNAYLIYPGQPPIPTSTYYEESEFQPPLKEIYNSDNKYPESPVQIVSDGYFDGMNHIVKVNIYPISYKPKSGELSLITNIQFNIKMKQGNKVTNKVYNRSKRIQSIYNGVLENIVDNPTDISLYRQKAIITNNISKSMTVPYYEYVIITSNSLASYFESFISWKTKKGWNVGIVTVQDIMNNYTGDSISGISTVDEEDTKEEGAGAIRQYLSDAHTNGTVWVLLGGDHSVVPVRYGAGSDNVNLDEYDDNCYNKIPTDLYFSDFTGDWNVDGIDTADSPDVFRYGEPSDDNPDYNPEIFIGRLPCNCEEDIRNWIDKLFKYEMYPGNGNFNYLTKAYWKSANQMINQPDYMKNYYPTSFSGRHTIKKGLELGSTMISDMSLHYGFLNWYCHGSNNEFISDYTNTTRCDHRVWTEDNSRHYWNTTMSQSSISGDGLDCMTNTDYPTIVYSICCETCAFDDFRHCSVPGAITQRNYPLDERSMVEGFLCMNKKINGPIKLGNTRYGYIYYSDDLHREFCNLWKNGTIDLASGQTSYHSGVAEAISKLNYTGSYSHYLAYSHNLFGCPETDLYTDIRIHPVDYTFPQII